MQDELMNYEKINKTVHIYCSYFGSFEIQNFILCSRLINEQDFCQFYFQSAWYRLIGRIGLFLHCHINNFTFSNMETYFVFEYELRVH